MLCIEMRMIKRDAVSSESKSRNVQTLDRAFAWASCCLLYMHKTMLDKYAREIRSLCEVSVAIATVEYVIHIDTV